MGTKTLKTSAHVIVCEIGICAILSVAILVTKQLSSDVLENISKIEQPLFDFNMAVIMAFLIAIITNNAFCLDGNRLKRIARQSLVFFLINSCGLIVSFCFDDYALAVMVSITFGNLLKFWDITENILGVI